MLQRVNRGYNTVYHQLYICMRIMYVGGRVPGLVCTLRCAMQWLVLLSGTALELADLAASYIFGIIIRENNYLSVCYSTE